MSAQLKNEQLGRDASPHAMWRDGMARKHHSSVFPSDYLRLSSLQADILVTHEAPSAHAHGFAAIDELALLLGAKLIVHGHHHESIDYRAQGMLGADSPFQAFGVDKGDFLAWPQGRDER